MSGLKAPSELPISPHSLYRQCKLKTFSGTIRPKLPILPISKGSVTSTKRGKAAVTFQITTMTQAPRVNSQSRATTSVSNGSRRKSSLGRHYKERYPENKAAKVELSTCDCTTNTDIVEAFPREYASFSPVTQDTTPKKYQMTISFPCTRERRFVTRRPLAVTPTPAISIYLPEVPL